MKTKTIVIMSLTAVLALTFAGICFGQEDVIVMDKRRVVKTYDFTKDGSLYVKNITGDISVDTWSGTKVEVEITKRGRRDDVEVIIDKRGDNLEIEVEYPRDRWGNRYNNDNWSASIHFDIKIPAKTRVEINSTTGDIYIKDVNGDIDAETTTGDIELENILGEIYAKSTTGSIEIYKITGDIESHSTTGHIEITDSKSRNIEARLTTGSIELDTDYIDERGDIDMRSTTGDVILTIPKTAKADFTARARPRSMHSDFDIFENDKDRMSRKDRRDKYVYTYSFDFSPKTFRGELNGGGCRINLSVSMGRIDIREK